MKPKGYRKIKTRAARVATALLLSPLFFISCSRCTVGDVREITIMSYNVQNLFDDVSNGTEYWDYDPGNGKWTADHFYAKMLALAEVIESAAPRVPDILALQEVENVNTLETLQEEVLKNAGYRYSALVETPGAAVNTAVLSTFPIDEIRSHMIHVEGVDGLRNILETVINIDGTALYLFNNHWKSKVGGAEETEYLRIEYAGLLAERIAAIIAGAPAAEIVVCGDLNENHDEYYRIEKAYLTALLPAQEVRDGAALDAHISLTEGPDAPALYSPWYDAEAQGSYVYRNSWETIDHFLLGPALFDDAGLAYGGFAVAAEPFMLDEAGHPLKWYSETRSGYSDHLPLLLTLTHE
jgi:endonuclease/exonuclease/phosphatase family metal-dependent hydrolase